MQKRDCRGLACPKPVLAAKELIDAHPEEIVEISVDNPASRENVARFLRSQGWEVSVMEGPEGVFSITGAPPTCRMAFPAAGETGEKKESGQKILVFIATDVLGQGSDELGRGLMKNFLATLKEMGNDLWRIVLVNNGVKLAITGSPCIDELSALDRTGTGILVCGTCLNHFGILDEKALGETTNMLDIVTSMELATKVIRI